MLIDTHCHLNLLVDYSFDTPLTIQDLENAGQFVDEAAAHDVTQIINVGTSLIESLNSIELARRYPHIYAAVGIHPNDITDTWQQELNELRARLTDKEELKIQGIGECGLDQHYPGYDIELQKKAFRAQIELALEFDLAIVIHTRDAQAEALDILETYKHEALRGTIHCFSEDQEFADRALALGFVLGFGGTVTYPRNNILRDVAQRVGLEHIILETDAPFLSPQAVRGTKNHPKNVQLIAQYLAQLLGTSYEDVARQSTENAQRIFRLSSK